jgi:glycoside hydrolase-like protein
MSFRIHAAVLVGLGSLVAAGWSATSSAATSERWRSVAFDGVRLSVPASWPVISFSKHPDACPRLDVHAVYLGTPGPNPICPAGLVGKTNAVMIGPGSAGAAPTDGSARSIAHNGAKARNSISRIMRTSPNWTVTRTITDVVPRTGTQVTISFGADRSLALAIQRTLEVTGSGVNRASHIGAAELSEQAVLAEHTEFASSHRPARAKAPSAPAGASGQGTFIGSGFDSCAAPSSSAMSNWLSSPYRAVGIYIGGANRACAQANLTPAWLTGITTQGWHYFPIYPGLQSSCVQASGDATITTSQAHTEGKAAADDAVTQATSLGIPAGTPLIYDMEAYGPACNAQVTMFLSAWDSELESRGYVSGVYESFTNIGALIAAAGSMTEPQVIYYADWDGDATTSSSYMPSAMWTDHQRLHQYQGSHLETYGGTSIDIDTDRLDVNLGSAPPAPADYASFRISVGLNTNGTAEWFARAADDTLDHSWQAPVGSLTWSAMHAVGKSPANVTSNPTVAPLAAGALTIFAQSGGGQLLHAWQQAGYPNDWEWGKALPKLATKVRNGTDPAAVLMPSGVVEVFQTEATGDVAAIAQTGPNRNGHWTGWQNLGGQCASTPVPLVDASHNVDLFCRTTGNSVAMTTWSGGSWGEWSPLAGGPADLAGVPSVVLNGTGQIELVATTMAGGLDDAWLTGSGSTGTWTWGTPLAGTGSGRSAEADISGSPTAAAWPAGQVIVYAKRTDGKLAYLRQTGPSGSASWGSWATIGGVPGGKILGSPSGWLNTQGAASVAVIDHNLKLAVASNSGTGWSTWSEVGSGF